MLLLYLLILTLPPLYGESYITYDFEGSGRLGDKIVNYAKCKWISLKYNTPLLYKPFEGSSFFNLHHEEKRYPSSYGGFRTKKSVICPSDINSSTDKTLFVTNYRFTKLNDFFKESLDPKEQEFLSILKKMITPSVNHEPELKSDGINIAVHVRKGEGYDLPIKSNQYYVSDQVEYEITNFFDHFLQIESIQETYKAADKHGFYKFTDEAYPFKFPPDQFYLDQIRKIAEFYPNQKLYIYIFTDAQNPSKLINSYANMLKDVPNLHFMEHIRQRPIEDLITMSSCDCLIRSCSNFAWVAHVIGSYKIAIYPLAFSWKNNQLMFKKVGITIH